MSPKLLLSHPIFSEKVSSGIFTIETFTEVFQLVDFSIQFLLLESNSLRSYLQIL